MTALTSIESQCTVQKKRPDTIRGFGDPIISSSEKRRWVAVDETKTETETEETWSGPDRAFTSHQLTSVLMMMVIMMRMMMVMIVMMMITLPELMMIVTLTWLLFHTRARPRSHWTIPPLDFISNQLPPPAVHSAWIKKPPRVKKPGTKRSGPAEGVGTLYMRRLYKCADTICQLRLYCQSFHRCWHQNTIFLNWFLTWNFRDTWVSN